MAPKRLTKRIEDLSYAIGKPEPYPGCFKGELVNILASVQELENGAAVSEAEAKVAAFETALEESKAENANLKAELKEAKAEIEAFQAAEREKQEDERKKDLPDKQFEILEWLPSEYSGKWRGIGEIAAAVGLAVDVAEIHLSKLRKAGFAILRSTAYDGTAWHRSETGNELVLAKRLASEGEQTQTQYYYPNLPDSEHIALGVIAAARENGASEIEIAKKLRQTVGRTRLALMVLNSKDFAGQPPEDPEKRWFLRTTGAFYLAERGLI
jgi:DNA-binding transcriptional ArsR family regulator